MDTEELKRYDRQILLRELGVEGQQRLKDASVLIVGAGGLSCPVLLYLAAAGIGRIGVIDNDLVEESNLQRQILYNILDLGKNKAETAIAKANLLNPHSEFTAYPFRLDRDNAQSIIKKYDVVIDGSDNFPTRYLVNDTCVLLKKPFVFGSLFQFEGQISVFNYNGGPDYRSLYPEAPAEGEVPNCGESGVIGTLPGIVGSYMANETLKLVADFGEILSGRLMTINALNNEIKVFNLSVIPDRRINDIDAAFNSITIKELQQWKNRKDDFILVDVREPYEYEESNIGGLNIPLYELPNRLSEIPSAEKIAFYCTSNYRSKIAINLLQGKRRESLFLINF